MVNTTSDYQILLKRPASNIRFILHGNLQSKKIILWYSQFQDLHTCDDVSQSHLLMVLREGVPPSQGNRTIKTLKSTTTKLKYKKHCF